MTKDNLILIRRVYNILISISIIVAGICLVAGCLSIYFSGEQPYSREAVAETFGSIAVPVYVCLGLTVIGFVLELLIPSVGKTKKVSPDYKNLLNRLSEKKDPEKGEKELFDAVLKERKSRKLHSGILAVLMFLGSMIFLVYALNGNNFHQSEINRSMINAMCWLIPCLAIPFGYGIFTVYRNERSLKREIELIKQAPSAENGKKTENNVGSSSSKSIAVLRAVMLLAGIGILVFGFVSGGTADVLTKAINICTECIGLG